jgi:hypothetical protein
VISAHRTSWFLFDQASPHSGVMGTVIPSNLWLARGWLAAGLLFCQLPVFHYHDDTSTADSDVCAGVGMQGMEGDHHFRHLGGSSTKFLFIPSFNWIYEPIADETANRSAWLNTGTSYPRFPFS